MKWRSIKVDVRFSLISSLRYLTFSSVRAALGRPLPGFRSVADPRSSTRLHIAVTEQSFQPFPGNFATVVRYPKPSFCSVSIQALSWYNILPITIVMRLWLEMSWLEILKNSLQCYVARKHKNNDITTKVTLIISYFNNKVNFLFSCEICSWSLRFRQFDVCQINTAQSNTLEHSFVTNKRAKFHAKIFMNFWDIAIFVLGYFILPHPV